MDLVAVVRPNLEYAKESLGMTELRAKVDRAIAEAVRSVNETVQTYKRIDVTILYEDEFPKNSSKKIKRFEIPALVMEQYRQMIEK